MRLIICLFSLNSILLSDKIEPIEIIKFTDEDSTIKSELDNAYSGQAIYNNGKVSSCETCSLPAML